MVEVADEGYKTLVMTKPNSVHIRMAKIEQKIDDMTDDYREHQLERLKSGCCSGDACVIYSEMLTDFERLGDHMLNIAEAAAESNLISLKIPEDINVEEETRSKKKIAAAEV
jgi:phosphate:Na+ symporter